MTIVAVAGDACTTTTVAIAAAWSSKWEALLVEADPSGGDLAAWFDMPVSPSLSTLVTRIGDGGRAEIDQFARRAHNGLLVVPAPARAVEAGQAIREAARVLVPRLAALDDLVALVDAGPVQVNPTLHPFVTSAAVTVVVHRQGAQSARAAAVRLQRLADQLDAFASVAAGVVVAIVGSDPFAFDDIERFLAESVGETPLVGLPVDGLAAATYAGRAGVSARRLLRLPLPKAARDLALAVERALPLHRRALGQVSP